MTDDTLDLLLGIVATISPWSTFIDEATILLPPLVPIALGAESGLLRQQRILLRREAPPATVDEMPMEAVELVSCHLVEQTDDHVRLHEVTGDIQHHTSVGHTGRVDDGELRQTSAVLPDDLQ